MTKIYLDHAATTPTEPNVLNAMLPYFSDHFGNSESEHEEGFEAKIAIDKALSDIASNLNCSPSEIVFTSGGTESNNLAIFGVTKNSTKKHIITTSIEHSSILEPCKQLMAEGYEITFLKVDKDGLIDLQELKSSIREDTALISVIYVNNEIGTIQPIKEISKITREHQIPFHIDACQAANYLELDANKLKVDLMTLNAGKIYGPKGIGLLYVRKGIEITPMIFGGDHQKGFRSGTMNTPGIVGFAEALKLAQSNRQYSHDSTAQISKLFIEEIKENFPNARINSPEKNRIPNIVNITFPGKDGKELVFLLSTNGICVSTGSACSTKKTKPSHVLTAIGLSESEANSSLRFSFGKENTKDEIESTIKVLKTLL